MLEDVVHLMDIDKEKIDGGCRDTMASPSSFPVIQKDNVIQPSFLDGFGPLCMNPEVTYFDMLDPDTTFNTTKPATAVGIVEFNTSTVSQPISNTADLNAGANLNLPAVGTKRKRDSELEPTTPVASSLQKNDVQYEALKRVRKKHRIDASQETEGNSEISMELLPRALRDLGDEVDTIFEDLRLRVEERASDEPMQVEETHTGSVLQADPPLWDDLEAYDSDDTAMVTEYSSEIVAYLKEVEKATMPNSNYVQDQTEINWNNRGALIDWIIQFHHKFRGNPETIYLCVNLIDRFLSKKNVPLAKLQVIGAVAYSIASKYEEIFPLSRTQLLSVLSFCDTSSSELSIVEGFLLKTLEWNLSAPGPLTWLRRGSKADDYNLQSRSMAKYLMEIGCLEHQMLKFVPSLVAAASFWLARLSLGYTEWSANFEHYTTYTEKELLPVAEMIIRHVLQFPVKFKCVHQEYRRKSRLGVSTAFNKWALQRWEQNAKVYLERDLPFVKAGRLKEGIPSMEDEDFQMMEGPVQESQG